MTSETGIENTETETGDVQPEAAPQYSDIEIRAQGMGHKPKEQWVAEGGNPDEWRTAREFVERGELLGTIHQLKRQQKDTYKAMQDMKSMLSGAEKKGREAAIAELKDQKVQALERGEYKKVADIDEQIAKTAAVPEQTGKTQVDPYVEYANEWVPKNPWFNADKELQKEFTRLARGFVHDEIQDNGAAPDPEDAFKYAEERVRRMYPEKFQPKRAPQTVATPGTTTRSTAASKLKIKWSDLPEEVQKAGSRLIRSGAFATREEYIEAATKSGVIQNG